MPPKSRDRLFLSLSLSLASSLDIGNSSNFLTVHLIESSLDLLARTCVDRARRDT